MQYFWVKFIKHLVRRPWIPVQDKLWSEHDSRKPNDQTVKAENSEDLDRKCWSLCDKEPCPNYEETDAKGPHAEGEKFQKKREASPTKVATKWARMGPGRSAQASCPGPFLGPFVAPFDLDEPQAIYSPLAKSHTSIHPPFAAEEHRREGHNFREERVELVI
jgi:hypothetical protein